jgi:hypothetical protein
MSTALENYQASLDACRKNMEPDLTEYKSICSRFNSSSTICKSNLQNKFNDICSLWVHKKVSYLINKAKQFLVPDPNCLVPLKRINGAKDCLSEINRISDKTLPTDLEKEIDNTESKIENATGVLADLVKILFYVTSIKVEIFTENHLFSTQDYYSFTECDVRKKISLLNLYDNTFLYNLVGMLRKGFEGSDPLECEDFCAFLSFYVEDMMNPKYVFVGDGSQDLKSKTVDWLRNTLPRVCIALFYLPGGCSRDETHHSAKEVITLSLGRTLASSLNKLDAIGNGYYWNNLSKHSK